MNVAKLFIKNHFPRIIYLNISISPLFIIGDMHNNYANLLKPYLKSISLYHRIEWKKNC